MRASFVRGPVRAQHSVRGKAGYLASSGSSLHRQLHRCPPEPAERNARDANCTIRVTTFSQRGGDSGGASNIVDWVRRNKSLCEKVGSYCKRTRAHVHQATTKRAEKRQIRPSLSVSNRELFPYMLLICHVSLRRSTNQGSAPT